MMAKHTVPYDELRCNALWGASQLSLILREALKVARSGHCQCRFIVQWTMLWALLLCFFHFCLIPHLKSQNWQSLSQCNTKERGTMTLQLLQPCFFFKCNTKTGKLHPNNERVKWLFFPWPLGQNGRKPLWIVLHFSTLGILHFSSESNAKLDSKFDTVRLKMMK